MSQTTEDIEAKLAAYVDGTLDEAGRAEIVKHLAAHPNHARLLADLSRGKEMLSSLPREKAPPEILDAIQSHLERRLLLDESAHERAAAQARGNVWGRRLALAAVLALSGTLVMVVYSVLPSPGDRSRELAELDRLATEDRPTVASADRDASASTPPVTSGPRETLAMTDRAAPASAAPPPAADVGGAISGAASPAPSVSPSMEAVGGGVGGVGGGGSAAGAAFASAVTSPAEVLVLLTDDRTTAESDLRAVLLENRLTFEPLAAAAAEEAGDALHGSVRGSEFRAPSGFASGGATLGDASAPTTAPAVEAAVARGRADLPGTVAGSALSLGKDGQAGQNEAVYVVRNVPRSQLQAINFALQQQQQTRRVGKGYAAQQLQNAPRDESLLYNRFAQVALQNRSQPAQSQQPDTAGQQQQREELERRVAKSEIQPDPSIRTGGDGMMLGPGAAAAGAGAGAGGTADEERKSASAAAPSPDAGAAAEPRRRAADGLPESTASLPPSAGIISSGETLHVRVSTAGPAEGEAAREQKLKVNDDGLIQMPDAAPVRALGLTPAELEQQLAAALRDKSTSGYPIVSVRREEGVAAPAAGQPTTPPVDAVTDVLIVVRQQEPSALEAADERDATTTRPAIPASQPASPLFRPPSPSPTTTRSSD